MAIVSEEWRDIEGWEGKYQVSSKGNVKSLSRMVEVGGKRKNRLHSRLKKEAVLSPGKTPTGYRFVTLYGGERKQQYYVHRLVASAFIRAPMHNEEVNHIDHNPNNNQAINLEWVTRSGNRTHQVRHKRDKSRAVVQMDSSGEEIAVFDSMSSAAKACKSHPANIRDACLHSWLAAGYRWKFLEEKQCVG